MTAAESPVDPELLDRVRARLAVSGEPASPAHVARALRAEDAMLGDTAMLGIVTALRSELAGAGPLEPWLHDPEISDVLVNAPDEVYVDRRGRLERIAAVFPDEPSVRRLAQRLAVVAGRRLDEACPWVDARLPDGTRLHAVIPPVSPRGTCLSLRIPGRRAMTLDDLVGRGSVPVDGAVMLEQIVTARLAFLVSGGTGTGKTTLLATLLGSADHAERLVLVEESGELRPDHPHVVRLETRPPNVEGRGEVVLRDLVRQALRMRPDRLVVGEVRGAEVVDLLAALNTGHEGGCGTVHANAAGDVPARIEALAMAAGLGRAAVHSQLAAGVQVVVHLDRHRDRRRVAEVCVLERTTGGLVDATRAARFVAGRVEPGPAARRLEALLSRGAG